MQDWLDRLRAAGLVAEDQPLRPAEEGRLIPLRDGVDLPPWIDAESLVDLEPVDGGPTPASWVDLLEARLDAAVVAEHRDAWPQAHDRIGDLLILRLPEDVAEFGTEVGFALLERHASARVALADEGVHGPYRVRRLRPLAARLADGTLIAAAEADLAALSTRTRLREHGMLLEVDPGEVYLSPRLAGERLGSLMALQLLRERLGRPLRVIDPYAGVAPALVPLMADADLVERVVAVDLNPAAAPLARLNLQAARRRRPPGSADVQVTVATGDARRLADDPASRGAFDALLVNLPHDSLEHLPDVLPLLAVDQATLLRGWAIVARDEHAGAEHALRRLLEPHEPQREPVLEVQRSFSASKWFCRYECILRRKA